MTDTRNKSRRFIYFYINRDEPEKLSQVVLAHVQYWKTANVNGYMGGPFGDRDGGLISFEAQNLQVATEIILHDPFIKEDLISDRWIKEWVLERQR